MTRYGCTSGIIWSAARLSSELVKPMRTGEASTVRSLLMTARQTLALSSCFTHSPGVLTQQPQQPEQPLRSRSRKIEPGDVVASGGEVIGVLAHVRVEGARSVGLPVENRDVHRGPSFT